MSPAGLHKMAYKEWGDRHNPRVLVCVHGLTRLSDDFDHLAEVMSKTHRVICPDIVGRGRSDWLRDSRFYGIPQYISDMLTLIARLDVDQVDWFGTSMGGLIAMGMASLSGNPIRKLLLNDVGCILNPEAIVRICEYVGKSGRFDTFEDGVKYVRSVSTSFGEHTDEQWAKFTSDVLRKDADGKWRLHYDTSLAIPFSSFTPESEERDAALLLAAYDAITCPTLLVRGAHSDLLTRETALLMTQRGPKAKLVEVDGVGHAPTFMHTEQIRIAEEFFKD